MHMVQDSSTGISYNMVLFDCNMQEEGCINIAKKIRDTVLDSVPLVILSDYGSDSMEEVLNMANTGIMSKPFFVSSFKEKIIEMQAEANEETAQETEEDNNLEGLHFLAAEDNEINAEILSEILSIEGASCEIVENGQFALERFASSTEEEFDAILMDVQMPVMNGYDATRAIRALKRKDAVKIPIIAMTANAFAEDERDALEAGMNIHLAKPVDVGLLKKVIKQCIQGKE